MVNKIYQQINRKIPIEYALEDLLFWLKEQRRDPAYSVDDAVLKSIVRLNKIIKLLKEHKKYTQEILKECEDAK